MALQQGRGVDDDGHRWQERSRHATSEGTVVYEHCHCGVSRVRTPAGASRVVGRGAGR